MRSLLDRVKMAQPFYEGGRDEYSTLFVRM